MRKLISCLLLGFAILFIWDLTSQEAHTYTGGSPGGYSGSPSDGGSTCTSCHGGGAPTTQTGLIASTIPAEGYTPGITYTLTLTASYQNRTKYGFELSVNNSGGTNIGGLIHTTTATRAVNTKNATHSNSGTAAAGGSRTWTLDWTAPASGSGNITFYLVVNATNSNGSSSGDVILKSTLTVSEKVDPCVINDLPVTADNSQLCQSASTTITLSNSQSGISYQLKNAGTNTNVGPAQSGTGGDLIFNTGTLTSTTTFKVEATKNANCSQTMSQQATVNVSNDPIPTISTSGPTAFCQGDSVTLTSSSGSSYSWSNGKTDQSIVVKSAGNYSVNVIYSSGCSVSSASKTVTVFSKPVPVLNKKGAIALCQGDSVVLSTGQFSSYNWNNGKTTRDIVVKTAGSYTVQVTDANGCKANSADTAIVSVGTKPSATITVAGNTTFCEGDSVKLSAAQGNSYLWSNGATTSAITVKTGGNFSVIVSSGSCSAKSDTIKTEVRTVADPTLNYTDTVRLCPGDSVELRLLNTADNYLWSTGATTQGIYVKSPGNYSAELRNSFGCKKHSATINVTVGNELHPIIQSSGGAVLCPGKSITLSAGKYFSYKWSTGSTDSSITVTQPGGYSLQVFSQSGCSGSSDTLYIIAEANPVVKLAKKGLIVGCDSVFLEATVGNFMYLWNTGQTTRTIQAKENGFHYVTATSSGGCSARSDSALLVLGKTPNANITFTGGVFTSTEKYRNQWFRNGTKLIGDTNQTLNLGPLDGDYYSVVTDEAGICTDTSNVIHIDRTGISSIGISDIQLYPNPAKEKLVISFNTSSFAQLKIYNLLGEEIVSLGNSKSPIVVDIPNLADGHYVARLIFSDTAISKQFSVKGND